MPVVQPSPVAPAQKTWFPDDFPVEDPGIITFVGGQTPTGSISPKFELSLLQGRR